MTSLEKEPELTEAQQQKFKALVGLIANDDHLRALLQTVPFDRRRVLYDQYKPFLKFKPKPFMLYKFY